MLEKNGSEGLFTLGPFRQLASVRFCPCADGKVRHCQIIGQPDTAFSTPARVKVAGKTVTGFVTYNEADGGWKFIANEFGKNGHLLPGIGYEGKPSAQFEEQFVNQQMPANVIHS